MTLQTLGDIGRILMGAFWCMAALGVTVFAVLIRRAQRQNRKDQTMTQPAAKPRADGPCHHGEPHAWMHHHPADSPVWIPQCVVCGVINGRDIAEQIRGIETLAVAAATTGLHRPPF